MLSLMRMPCCGAREEVPRAAARTSAARSPGLFTGVERAQRAPAGQGNSRAHLSAVPALTRAYRRQRADAAGGVEGIPKEQDGGNREAHLQDLQARLQAQRYRPPPIRLVPLPTAQGKTRPIGIAACEDQVVQDAGREGGEALSAQDVLACSQGFRPGRKAHDAGRSLQRMGDGGGARGISEADSVSFFDRVDRTKLQERLGMRVADGARMRRIGQGVHVGVRDGETMGEPEVGTAQGAVRSPL